MATHWTLGCDANDPQRLADFWAQALGYVRGPWNMISRERLIRAKVPELVECGATVVREDYDEGVLDHVVMLDPEGNEFCVA